jgi:uncharacterized membrane protein YgdD (TMEM256/DUF423 family)
MNATNPWLAVAALSGLAAVAAGAYGAHGLAGEEKLRQSFMIGVQYHMWHTFALLAVAWFTDARQGTDAGKWAGRAGGLFAAGIVLFSGTLYWFGVTGELPVTGAAPLGGVSLMTGWAVLAFAATRKG